MEYRINDQYDVALLRLDRPATGIAPAALPEARVLDDALKGDSFTHVGYGLNPAPRRHSGPNALAAFTRRTLPASMSRLSRTQFFTRSPDGALCDGDSGGPVFDGRVIVALGNSVSGYCKGTNSGPRLDIEPVQSFLKQYVG